LPLQGALLIAIIPRAMPWAKSFCPFRACCFWSFLAFRACCFWSFLGLQPVSTVQLEKYPKDAWLEHDMIQYEKQGNCRLQSVQTIASFLYHFFYIPYSVFKKEVLSLPAKVK
jgi:hypothetical protein